MKNEENQKYHFFSANLNYYGDNQNFKKLLDEEEKYGGFVYWGISYKNGNGLHEIRKGDVCYIYYSNLPDGSSRILFEGTVEDADENSGEKSICPDADGKKLYMKLKIKCISLEDKDKFSLKNLRDKYDFISKKGRIGYRRLDLNNKNHLKLKNDLEEASSKNTHCLKRMVDYFNENFCLCEFSKNDIKRKNHETFQELNGCYYIERHHLVARQVVKKYTANMPKIDKIIEQEENIFRLCPNCHKEMHHGTKERRREKIEFLYNKRKSYFDKNFGEISKKEKKQNTLEWLYEIYNCD